MNINHNILIWCLISLAYGLDNTGFNRLDSYHKLGECADTNCKKENSALINIIKIIERNDKFNHKLNSCKNCMVKLYEKLNDTEKCIFDIGKESRNLKYDKLSYEEKRNFLSKKYELLNYDEKLELKNCLIENECQMKIEFYKKYKDKNEFKQLIKCLNKNCLNEFKIINSTDLIKSINSTNTIEQTTIYSTTKLIDQTKKLTDKIATSTNLNQKMTKSTNLNDPTEPTTKSTDLSTSLADPIDNLVTSTNLNQTVTKSTNLADRTTKLNDPTKKLIDSTTKLSNPIDKMTNNLDQTTFNAITNIHSQNNF